MTTTTPTPAQAALDALSAWARQQTSIRPRLVAAAWYAGMRNIRAIAQAAGVSRDTIYADLTRQDIDYRDRSRPEPSTEVTVTTVVPWGTVTDEKGRRAWTAGQLRAALAGLDDDAPVVVHVATDEDGVVDDQIITSAGHGSIAWESNGELEPDPIFTLECHGHTAGGLHIRPRR